VLIERGVRTGKFRTGVDDLLVDEHGKSWISYEDYAVALVDELEEPQNERQRFTVGY
jgi:putative NADH-flavin reductase